MSVKTRDDRKTHKRDIEHKKQSDDEIEAEVVEITDSTPHITSTNEPIDTTTEILDPTTTAMAESTTAAAPLQTTQQTPAAIVDPGFQPILDFYYGGTPNENANFIYFTTPLATPETTTQSTDPNTLKKRSDFGQFQPSIRYEYRNYRFNTDNHFIPVVGTQQIF